MASLNELRGRLFSILKRDSYKQRLREEMELHLQMLVDANLSRGMSAEEARRVAHIEFGNREQVQEQFHERTGLPFLESVVQDVRSGLRGLIKNPGFTAVALLTLALGIGANTAIYSYVEATWLRPLQVRNPDRVMRIYSSGRQGSSEILNAEFSYLDFVDLRTQSKALERVVAYEHRGAVIYRGNELKELLVDVVSPNYFSDLGVPAMLGRTFTEADGAEHPSVVISNNFWKEYFGGDRSIVGRQVRLSNGIITIVGVLGPEFRGADIGLAPAVFMPASTWTHITGSRGEFTIRENRRQSVLAQMRTGQSLESVKAELDTIASRLRLTYPEADKDLKFTAIWDFEARGEDSKKAGLMLLGIAGMVILIACANAANLQLARAETRKKEIATRLALGCSRSRVVRQLLTESAVLTALGGMLALVMGWWVIHLLPQVINSEAAATNYDFRIDKSVLLFTGAVALLSTLLFGLVPAYQSSKVELTSAMKESENKREQSWRLSLRNMLVIAQIALSLVLLVGAGLLIRTLQKVRTVDVGFDSRQKMLMLNVVPGLAELNQSQLQAFYDNAINRLVSLPGVDKVSLALRMPFSPSGGGARETVAVPGVEPPEGQQGFDINDHVVGPGYFDIMGTKVLQGRGFERVDANGPKVVIVNETMAKQFWPGQNPVDRQLEIVDRERTSYTVVGVVKDSKWNAVTEENRPLIYLPLSQNPRGEMTILLSTKGDPSLLIAPARAELAKVDNKVPLLSAITLTDYMDLTFATERNRALLATAFSALGMALAALGIYGVMAYLLSRRTREIGIRIAIGAQRWQILRLVLGHGLQLTAIGLAVGLAGSLLAKRLFADLLFGVEATDPATILTVVVVLSAVAMVASYVPARRALKIDPSRALRHE